MEDQCFGTPNRSSVPRLPGGAAALIRSSNPAPSGLLAKRYGVSTGTYIPMIIKCANLLAAMATR